MFKLQVLLLAKMQWDVVQRPDQAVRPQNGAVPWPAAALTKALRMLRSPYVAGDLLQQRAPGLLAHTFKGSGPLGRSPSGVRWMAKEVRFSVIPVSSLAGAIGMTARAMLSSHADVDAIGERATLSGRLRISHPCFLSAAAAHCAQQCAYQNAFTVHSPVWEWYSSSTVPFL
jgi:hypothetical protein